MRRLLCLIATLLVPARIASAQTAAIDPCALLTKEDAAAAMGVAVVKGPDAKRMPNGGPSACSYEGSGLNSITLNLFPFGASEAAMYRAMCAQKSHDGLTGLGDVSCWYNEKHGELQVLKGTSLFSIQLHRSGDPTEPIKAAARRAYERLK